MAVHNVTPSYSTCVRCERPVLVPTTQGKRPGDPPPAGHFPTHVQYPNRTMPILRRRNATSNVNDSRFSIRTNAGQPCALLNLPRLTWRVLSVSH